MFKILFEDELMPQLKSKMLDEMRALNFVMVNANANPSAKTIADSLPGLRTIIDRLEKAHGESWKKTEPFLFATNVSFDFLSWTASHHPRCTANWSELARNYLETHNQSLCQAEIDRLLKFLAFVDEKAGMYAYGFVYNEPDKKLSPMVIDFCKGSMRGLTSVLKDIATKHGKNIQPARAEQSYGVSEQQQKEDGILIVGALSMFWGLKDRVKKSKQEGEKGRIVIEKHCDVCFGAYWQPLTRGIQRSLLGRGPNDHTLEWLLEDSSDTFVATVSDGCESGSPMRTYRMSTTSLDHINVPTKPTPKKTCKCAEDNSLINELD